MNAAKILFLVPYPMGQAPSQRFRFEQYFEILDRQGHQYHVQSFLDPQNNRVFYKPGNLALKGFILLKGIFGRFRILFRIKHYQYVFIHRELTPLGPPIFEWIIAKILNARIIYDFDDAIWLTDRKNESFLLRTLKWRSKVASICRWSFKVSCGNHYLGSYAGNFNASVAFNPSTIDTENLHNPALFKTETAKKVRVGWTGSHSTLKYLKDIEPVIGRLEAEYDMEFVVIADRKPELSITNLRFIPWNAATEIPDLLQVDIGIMPLPDDEWSKGKCGFKLLQYMALEIPAVAARVGANVDIVSHGETGFLCTTPQEWYTALKQLIEDKTLRRTFGTNGRAFVKAHYSVRSNTPMFAGLFA